MCASAPPCGGQERTSELTKRRNEPKIIVRRASRIPCALCCACPRLVVGCCRHDIHSRRRGRLGRLVGGTARSNGCECVNACQIPGLQSIQVVAAVPFLPTLMHMCVHASVRQREVKLASSEWMHACVPPRQRSEPPARHTYTPPHAHDTPHRPPHPTHRPAAAARRSQ